MIIDLHSHILPGLDDGAADWNEFLRMSRLAVREEISCMVCSSHFIPFATGFSLAEYRGILLEAQKKLAEEDLKLDLVAGSEVFLTFEVMRSWQQGELLTINDTGKYLLVEFPALEIPTAAKEIFFFFKLQGVTPIIAHPERNRILQNNTRLLAEFIAQGVLCQLNTGSITGMFGKSTRQAAKRFLRSGMYHFLASDAHSAGSRAPKFQAAVAEVKKIVGEERAHELTQANPLRAVTGEEIEPYPLELQVEKKRFWFF